jgi:glycosyltransferase involved in cell wall biosynthesis
MTQMMIRDPAPKHSRMGFATGTPGFISRGLETEAHDVCLSDALPRLGIPAHSFHIDGVEFYGRLSVMKAGLVYASHLTTVSQTYAAEITTPEFGCGLDGILRKRAERNELLGILNGIDEIWDPRTCTSLTRTFDAGDWRRRSQNAREIRHQFGLAVSRGPLFALVARLVHQKGVDLVIQNAKAIVDAGGQIIVTGKGEARFEEALRQTQVTHPGAVAVKIGFDDEEARRIFAGSDFTLMPSRFEPCGLSQMYAQRFGSLPIGHRTGGLAETILDGQTGFLFERPSSDGLLSSLCRAFSTFGARDRLDRMRRAAMGKPSVGPIQRRPTPRSINPPFSSRKRDAMKIAQVTPLAERCPPKLYEATERIVSYLTEEMVRLGHDMALFAEGDSVQTRSWPRALGPYTSRSGAARHDALSRHDVGRGRQASRRFRRRSLPQTICTIPMMRPHADCMLTNVHAS